MKVLPFLPLLVCTSLGLAHSLRAGEPLYENSIVSNDLDFILDTDPSALESLRFIRLSREEMPDKRKEGIFAEAYVFEAIFTDKTRVEIWAHADFGSEEDALVYVKPLANAIGQQPHFNRADLDHVVLHSGNEGAFAEEDGKFFVIYSENMDVRLKNHDLQETVFHESAHVAFEGQHAAAPGWVAAQKADSAFITEYARELPLKEDIPESAIFAFVILNHPGRLPPEVEAKVAAQIPHRIAYFGRIAGFSPTSP